VLGADLPLPLNLDIHDMTISAFSQYGETPLTETFSRSVSRIPLNKR
jgi:hypothetical protein